MHILASGPELQAVRLGYVFMRKLRRRGGTPKKFTNKIVTEMHIQTNKQSRYGYKEMIGDVS